MCTCIYAWNCVYVRACLSLTACCAPLSWREVNSPVFCSNRSITLRIQCFRATKHIPTIYTGGYRMAAEVCPHGTHWLQRHPAECDVGYQSSIPCYTPAITRDNLKKTHKCYSLCAWFGELMLHCVRHHAARGSLFKTQMNKLGERKERRGVYRLWLRRVVVGCVCWVRTLFY